MWEREAVTAATARLLRRVRVERQGGALFVIGEAGLGKTAVVEQASRLAGPDFKIGFARGDPMESMLVFGLLSQSVDGLGGHGLLEPAPAGESGTDRRAAQFFAVLRWLEGQAGPLLWALDDLHWADADSLAMVSFLCRRVSSLAVAVIGTLRPWPSAAQEVAQSLNHSGAAALERLLPLSETATRELLTARLGRKPADDVARQAWTLAGGNPLLLEQVALAIRQGEDLPAPARVSPRLADEMLLARFAGLPRSGMQLVRAASVLGARFKMDVAAEVAQLPEDDVDVAVDAFWQSGLVRESGHTAAVEFVHPLFQQAVYDGLGLPVVSRLHARAFSALARRGAEAEAGEHAIRGHLVGSSEAIRVLEDGGRAALRAGALGVACKHLAAAAELAGDHVRPELLLVLGEALLAAGRATEAIRACERLCSNPALPAPARVQALRMLGRALASTGAYERAAGRFDEAVRIAQPHDVGAAVQILLDHALTSWLSGGPAKSLPLAERARRLAQDADDAVRRGAEATWGFIALQAGDVAGLEATAAAAEPVARDPLAHQREVSWTWGPLTTYGLAATDTERLSEADRVFRIAVDAAERLGAAEAVATLRILHAYTLMRMGRLNEALTLVELAEELLELVPMAQAYAAASKANIMQFMGRLDESQALCDQAEPSALEHGDWVALLFLWDVRGRRLLLEGRFADCSDLYLKVEAASTRMGIGEPCLVPWARHAVLAHAGAGRLADASRVLEWLERCAAALPCRWPRIAIATGRAAVAEAGGDRATAEELFQEALGLHEGLELPIQKVETLHQYGAFLRRSGQPSRARSVLTDALRLAEDVGAQWLANHVHRELTSAGGRRRRREEPERLTSQEHRVAELAASGLTNKEIAQRLWLHVSTVESHLQQVYSKLGIRSRRQLMTLFAGSVTSVPLPKVPGNP